MFLSKKIKAISAAVMLGASVFMFAGCGGGKSSDGPKKENMVARKEVKTPALREVKYGKDKITAKIYKLETTAEVPEIMSQPMYVVGKSLFANGKNKKLIRVEYQNEKINKIEVVAEKLSEPISTADDKFVFYRVGKTVNWMDEQRNIKSFTEKSGYINLMRVRGDNELVYYVANGDRKNVYKAKLSGDKLTGVQSKDYENFKLLGIRGNYSEGKKLYLATRIKHEVNGDKKDLAGANVIDTGTDKVVKVYDTYSADAGKVNGKGSAMLQNNPTVAVLANYIVFHDNGSKNRIRILKKSDGKFVDDITAEELGIEKIRAITAVPGTNDIIAAGYGADKKWAVYRIDI